MNGLTHSWYQLIAGCQWVSISKWFITHIISFKFYYVTELVIITTAQTLSSEIDLRLECIRVGLSIEMNVYVKGDEK